MIQGFAPLATVQRRADKRWICLPSAPADHSRCEKGTTPRFHLHTRFRFPTSNAPAPRTVNYRTAAILTYSLRSGCLAWSNIRG